MADGIASALCNVHFRKSPSPEALAFYEWALKERLLSPKTAANYFYAVRAADAWLRETAGTPLEDANFEHLERYLSTRKLSAAGRNHVRLSLISFFEYRTGSRMNPASDLRRHRVHRPLPKPIPKAKLPALLEAGKRAGPETYALLVLFAYTGLRLSEVTNLRWEQFGDLSTPEPRWISLIQKGGGERAVYVRAEVIEALAHWHLECKFPSMWVFPSRTRFGTRPKGDRHLTRVRLWQKVSAVGTEVGLEHCHPHAFRHLFATTMLESNNGNIMAVKEALGHSSVTSTQIYARVKPEVMRESVETLSYGPMDGAHGRQLPSPNGNHGSHLTGPRLTLKGILERLDEDVLTKVATVLDGPDVLASLERASDDTLERWASGLTGDQLHGFIGVQDLQNDVFKWDRRWWCYMYVLAALAILNGETPNYSAIVMEASRVTDQQAESFLFQPEGG